MQMGTPRKLCTVASSPGTRRRRGLTRGVYEAERSLLEGQAVQDRAAAGSQPDQLWVLVPAEAGRDHVAEGAVRPQQRQGAVPRAGEPRAA
jgi:hypothetical protein